MWSVQDKNKDGHLQHRLISGLGVEVYWCLKSSEQFFSYIQDENI
jgi:hypothetical protein